MGAIQTAVTTADPVSRTRDTSPAAAATLDYGLSQRTLIAVSSRAGDVAEPGTHAIGEDLEHGLAARGYALSSDRRALHGTVL